MQFAGPYLKENPDGYCQIDFGDFSLIGKSIAGVETILCFPNLNVMFDTGRSPDFVLSVDYLALTHWHLDHAGGLMGILNLRCLNSLPGLKIIVPQNKKEESENFLKEITKICEMDIAYEILTANQVLPLKKNYLIKAIDNFHCVSSTGYLVESIKKSLKNELKGKTENEIIEIKKKGIQVDEEKIIPLLAFSGDSEGHFLETEAKKAKILMMECSFFGDKPEMEKVKKYGHTHILDWKKYADEIESETIIMTHTSQRYSKMDIQKSCEKNLPKNLLDKLIVLR